MINATMCFLRSDGKTLFLYRNRGKDDIHNGWHVPPGGRTEPGERGIDCLLREFEEETGLKLHDPKLRNIVTYYNKGRLLGGKLDQDDHCVETYEAAKYSGELRAEHEKAKPLWVPDNEVRQLKIYTADVMIFEMLNVPGVFQTIVQYSGEDMIRFDTKRVA